MALAVPAFVLAAGLASLTLAEWLADTSKADFWKLLLEQKQNLLYGLGWWTAWCAGTRWLTSELRWRAHALIVACAALAFGGLAVAGPVVVAAASPLMPGLHRVANLLSEVGWLSAATGAALAHVSAIAAPRGVRMRLRVAACATSIVLGASPAWD